MHQRHDNQDQICQNRAAVPARVAHLVAVCIIVLGTIPLVTAMVAHAQTKHPPAHLVTVHQLERGQ